MHYVLGPVQPLHMENDQDEFSGALKLRNQDIRIDVTAILCACTFGMATAGGCCVWPLYCLRLEGLRLALFGTGFVGSPFSSDGDFGFPSGKAP